LGRFLRRTLHIQPVHVASMSSNIHTHQEWLADVHWSVADCPGSREVSTCDLNQRAGLSLFVSVHELVQLHVRWSCRDIVSARDIVSRAARDNSRGACAPGQKPDSISMRAPEALVVYARAAEPKFPGEAQPGGAGRTGPRKGPRGPPRRPRRPAWCPVSGVRPVCPACPVKTQNRTIATMPMA